MLYYTYLHRRASDGLPFYIGKGAGNRAWKTSKRNPHWRHTVAKHGRNVEVLAHWGTEQEALEHERFLIECFRDMGFPMVNIAEGGNPGPVTRGMPKSSEHRAKIAAAHLGKPKRRHTEESRARKSAAAIGRVMPEEVRKKIGAANKGKKRSPEACARIAEAKKSISQETRAKMSEAAKARCARASSARKEN